MYMYAIELYYFITLSVALIVAKDLKVSRKQNLLGSFSHTFKLDVLLKQFILTIMIVHLSGFYVIKGDNCFFLLVAEKTYRWHAFLDLWSFALEEWQVLLHSTFWYLS